MATPDSHNSSERMLDEMNTAEVNRLIPTIVFLVIVSITGMIGNGLVCHVYRTRFRLSNSQCFILCLSAIDLFSCCVVIPFEVATIIQQYNFTLLWLCKISRFFNSLTTLSGSFLLVFIAIDRYRKVCKPFGWQISSKVVKVLSMCSPLLGMVFAWPSVVLYGKKTFPIPSHNITGTECSTDDAMKDTIFPLINQAVFAVLFVSGMIVISILYCLIGREVHKHVKRTPKEYLQMNTSIPMLSSTADPRESKIDLADSDSKILAKYEKELSDKKRRQSEKTVEESDVSWSEKPEAVSKADDSEHKTSQQQPDHVTKKVDDDKGDNKDNSSDDSGIKTDQNGKEEEEKGEHEGHEEKEHDVKEHNDNKEHEEEGPQREHQDNISTSSTDSKSVSGEGQEDSDKTKDTRASKTNLSMYSSGVKRKLSSMKDRMESVMSRMASVVSSSDESKSDTLGKAQFLKQARARKTAFLMFLISLAFLLSYLPHLMLMLIRSVSSVFVESMDDDGRAVYRFFLRSYFLNCAINPVIYGVCDSRFRSACKEVCSCCKGRHKAANIA